MAVSGTTDFELDILEIIEEAYEQAEIEARTGYDMRSARRSLDLLMIEWGNKGYNLWTVREATQVLTPGVGNYQLGADNIDIIEFVLTSATDTTRDTNLRRVPLAVHASRNNKQQRGRPAQIFVDRQRQGPIVNLWPVPDEAYTLRYWAMRRINDAGVFTNTVDAPTRFLPALTTGLAHKLALKKNRSKVEMLAAVAKQLWVEATDEDRDRSDVLIYPDIC